MEIEYLKDVKEYQSRYPTSKEWTATNEQLPLEEIIRLEKEYNNSKPFPKALRELLFLAGEYCNILESESNAETQLYVQELLEKNKQKISRPFYVIEMNYSSVAFWFIYLDEGDDPPVYQGIIKRDYQSDSTNFKIDTIESSLSSLLSKLIIHSKERTKRHRESGLIE